MALLLNRAKMTTATTGTGTVTLGSAVSPYQSYAAAGAVNGLTYANLYEDGTAWELSQGVYTSSGTTMTRVLQSSSTGSLLNLSGNATVACVARVSESYIPPSTRLARTTTQSITNSTWTLVSWDTTPLNDDVAAFAAGTPTQVTVPTGYTWAKVQFCTAWASNNTGIRYSRVDYDANTLFLDTRIAEQETNSGWSTPWFPVVAGKLIQLLVIQTSGGSLNLSGGSAATSATTRCEISWSS